MGGDRTLGQLLWVPYLRVPLFAVFTKFGWLAHRLVAGNPGDTGKVV